MKKIIALLLCLVMSLGIMAGCNKRPEGGSGNEGGDETGELKGTLEIVTMNKGYGYQFALDLKAAYEVINPDVTVNVNYDVGDINGEMDRNIPGGEGENDVDLYFGSGVNIPRYTMGGDLMSLDKMLDNLKPYGMDISMRERIDGQMLEMLKYDNTQYSIPWAAGACGFVYNEKLFNDLGLTVPETTDDLIAVSKRIIELNTENTATPGYKKVYPFIWAGGNATDYWDYIVNVWWAQYEGLERYNKYWSLHDGKPFQPNKDYITQEGQKMALRVAKSLVENTDMSYSESTSLTAKDAQEIFVRGDAEGNRFAMMPCGDWFFNEAGTTVGASQIKKNYKMMKTPKLSAAITKHGNENVKDYAYTLASTHNIAIPSYSDMTYVAKDFLCFMFGTEGSKIFTKATGSFLPLASFDEFTQTEIEGFNDFQKSQLDLLKQTDYVYTTIYQSPMRYKASLKYTDESIGHPVMAMAFNNKTADEIWQAYINFFMLNWNDYITEIGL